MVSFYKLFGSPTGLGALFVKRHHRRKRPNRGTQRWQQEHESMYPDMAVDGIISKQQEVIGSMKLERSCPPRHFFGGGSVDVVLPDKDFVASRNAFAAMNDVEQNDDEHVDLGVLVHGTEHFRGIANLVHGFREIDDYGGMKKVSIVSLSDTFITSLSCIMPL